MKNLTAVVLAGGIGKRFKPFTISKPLFPFLGKPLITQTLESLASAGITKTIIITNQQDQAKINALKIKHLQLQTIVQVQALGMADALLKAKPAIENNPILVLNATDQVDPLLLKSIVNQATANTALIVGKEVTEYFAGGYLKFKNNKLIAVIEKPKPGKQPSNLVNLVFHYFPKATDFISCLEKATSQSDDIYEVALSRYFKQYPTQAIEYSGYWQALKYPWHALDMTQLFLNHHLKPNQHSSAKIAPTAIVEKNVNLGKNVQVLAGAIIKGPSYIGDNTIIGNNSLIRQSLIGDNCVVGFNSEVVRSYLGSNCWLHTNYIGDSLLEGNIAFGSGAITANYRLDETEIAVDIGARKINTHRIKLGALIAKSVRVGVNTSLMPGIIIGTNSIIGPGLVLKDNIKPNTYLFYSHNLKSKLISKPIKSR